jgi:hypothetical protein
LAREEDARVGLRAFAMKRMLTEVIWRVNVRAMRNPRNPLVYAHYRIDDASLRPGSAGILAVRGTPPPGFLQKESVK